MRGACAIWLAFAAICVGCVQAEKPGAGKLKASGQSKLSPETMQRIISYESASVPWQGSSPETLLLRLRIFELERQLMRLGREVRPPSFNRPGPVGYSEYWDKQRKIERGVRQALQLSYVGPKKFTCSEKPVFKVRLKNRTKKPLCLLVWNLSFRVSLVHSSGNIPRRNPAVRAKASHVPFPRPEDYVTLKPGQAVTKEIAPDFQYSFLPPGRYHLWLSYWAFDSRGGVKLSEQLGVKYGHVATCLITTRVMPVDFVVGNDVNHLVCSLAAEKTRINLEEDLVFTAVLRNTSKTRHITIARTGSTSVKFYDPAGGRPRRLAASVQPAPKPISDKRLAYYPRRDWYVQLAPGREIKMTLTVSPKELARHAGFFRRGKKLEAVWEYGNRRNWYLQDGRVFMFGNVWVGRIASRPVPLSVAGR